MGAYQPTDTANWAAICGPDMSTDGTAIRTTVQSTDSSYKSAYYAAVE